MKRKEEELSKLGLGPADAHRLESAEVAEAKRKKKVSQCALMMQSQYNKCIDDTVTVQQVHDMWYRHMYKYPAQLTPVFFYYVALHCPHVLKDLRPQHCHAQHYGVLHHQHHAG